MGVASIAFTSACIDERKLFAKSRESFSARFRASFDQLRAGAAGEFKWIRFQPTVGDRVIQHGAKKLQMPVRIGDAALFLVLGRLSDQVEFERFDVGVFDGDDPFLAKILAQYAPVAL